ncbi:hypothetical protein BGZ82_007839, partial [Podila clonocystis]
QQPSHEQPVSAIQVVFTLQPAPLIPRPDIAQPPVFIPVSSYTKYYQDQSQHTPYQIPIVHPQASAYQPNQQQQEQQIPREFESQRIHEPQFEEELDLARHIEEQTARLKQCKTSGKRLLDHRFSTSDILENHRSIPNTLLPRLSRMRVIRTCILLHLMLS